MAELLYLKKSMLQSIAVLTFAFVSSVAFGNNISQTCLEVTAGLSTAVAPIHTTDSTPQVSTSQTQNSNAVSPKKYGPERVELLKQLIKEEKFKKVRGMLISMQYEFHRAATEDVAAMMSDSVKDKFFQTLAASYEILPLHVLAQVVPTQLSGQFNVRMEMMEQWSDAYSNQLMKVGSDISSDYSVLATPLLAMAKNNTSAPDKLIQTIQAWGIQYGPHVELSPLTLQLMVGLFGYDSGVAVHPLFFEFVDNQTIKVLRDLTGRTTARDLSRMREFNALLGLFNKLYYTYYDSFVPSSDLKALWFENFERIQSAVELRNDSRALKWFQRSIQLFERQERLSPIDHRNSRSYEQPMSRSQAFNNDSDYWQGEDSDDLWQNENWQNNIPSLND